MSSPRIGGLCFGYGGLDMAVQSVIGGDLAWYAEYDKGASKIGAHRFPGVLNHGDMTAIDWAAVEPVDVLTGGTPCQDLSHAGKRAGMTEGTRSNLWVAMREAIATIRPRLVVWENVAGAYSATADSDMERREGLLGDRPGRPALRALGRVLGDLASLGYDASWHGLRAADVGAPHGRLRVFVVAWPAADARRVAGEVSAGRGFATVAQPASDGDPGRVGVALLPTPRAGDGDKGGPNQRGSSGDLMLPSAVVQLLPTPAAHEPGGTAEQYHAVQPDRWGEYGPAIHRWEALTRPAPPPTEVGIKGNARLSPRFSEWMMGLPDGWVTDVPGITRNEVLKALGNGVVPQQAAHALRLMLGAIEGRAAA